MKDKYSRTPFLKAVQGGHEAVVKLLLKIGQIKVNSKDKDSRALLSLVAERGHKAVVKLLLEMG